MDHQRNDLSSKDHYQEQVEEVEEVDLPEVDQDPEHHVIAVVEEDQ